MNTLASEPGDESWDDRFGPNDDLDDYDENVRAIAVAESEIYIGGIFWVRGAPYWNGVAKWDGKGWSSLGRGVGGRGRIVNALAIFDNDLYVGGSFTEVDDTIPANNIAKWNRATKTWSTLNTNGENGVNATIMTLVAHKNELYAGGSFTIAGGAKTNHIAIWNSSTETWTPMGSGINGVVNSIVILDTAIYAGGHFSSAGGMLANNIAKWDGHKWSALDDGLNDVVYAIAIMGDEVYVGGDFTKAGNVEVCKIAKWNTLGKKWSAVGNNVHHDSLCYGVHAMAASGNYLYIGGIIEKAVANLPYAIAKWNPIAGSWTPLGSGLNSGVRAILSHGSDVYTGGYFTQAGGKPSTRFAIWHEPEQNHAPVINSSLPTLSFNEDTSLLYPISKWYSRVQDQEDADSALAFTVIPGKKVQATRQGNNYLFTAPQNWFGQNKLKLIVADRGQLADTVDFFVRVKPVNDAPAICGLPEIITFSNNAAESLALWDFVSDVDNPDSSLHYSFSASNNALQNDFNHETGSLSLTAPGFQGKVDLFISVRDDSNAIARDTVAVQVDFNTGVTEDQNQIPQDFVLMQNHPNPFNPTTIIRFGLPQAAEVKLEVYDLSGRRVAIMVNERKEAGYHNLIFEGSALPSGAYYYRLTAGDFCEMKKFLLIK